VRRLARAPVGLLGRLLAILLAALAIEFATSTLFYERASRALVRDDEAHRLAEHLVIARTLVADQPPAARPAMAVRLTTARYVIRWLPRPGPAEAPAGGALRRAVLDWEPGLNGSALRVALAGVGRRAQLKGSLLLPDRSALIFRAMVPEEEAAVGRHRVMVALLPFTALLLIGALLLRHTLRPMRMLARAAERLGRSGGGPTLPEAGPAEVRRVIRAFNTMQARIGQLIRDRTEALAAVGHDLRTPLARLQLRADAVADPELRRAVESDVAEMEAMVQSLLSFLGGADDPEPPVRTDVAVMAATVVDNAADRGGDATYEGIAHLEASVRPVALKRAIGNLVENALHYGHSARVAVLAQGSELLVRIEDEGPGIPPDRLDEVVQPFARLDAARRRNTGGLGLGLAIVARAMEAEGGALRLVNRAEGGLCAELRLPLR